MQYNIIAQITRTAQYLHHQSSKPPEMRIKTIAPWHLVIFLSFFLSLIERSEQWCLKKQVSDSDDILSIDFSPDGTMFVTGSKSKYMRVWSMLTFQPLFSFYADKQVKSAKFSKDQSFIVMGVIAESTIRVFLAKHPWTQLGSFSAGHTNTRQVDVNEASNRILTCGDDNRSKVWTFNAAFSSFTQFRNKDALSKVLSCRFARNSDGWVVGTQKVIRVYQSNGDQIQSYGSDVGQFFAVDWSPDDSKVVGACQNNKGYYQTFDSFSSTYLADYDDMFTTTFARDGQYILFGGKDNKGYLINQDFSTKLNSSNPIQILTDPSQDLVSSAMSYDSNFLMIGDTSGNAFLYQKICTGCAPGLYPGLQACEYCAKMIKGCAICYNNTKCLQCFNGYYHDATSNTCLTCDSAKNGCVMCTNSSICLACAPGYYLDSGNCVRCLLLNAGCVLCSSAGTCLACESSFYLSTNVCSSCQLITNCIRCNASNYCLQCKIGFFENNGACTNCPANCRFCHSLTSCIQCASGFKQSSGLCVRCGTGCASCNSSACLDCTMGMYLSTGSCSKCDFPCSSCNASAYCFSCVTGYYLSVPGTCINCVQPCISCSSNTNCLSCPLGYFLVVGTPNTCALCTIPNCHTCNSTSCFYCEPQYFLSLGSCSLCRSSINNCMTCSNNSECQFCLQGYYHTGGSGNSACAVCPAGCSNCKNAGSCSSCLPRFYYNSGVCTECSMSNHCDTCQSASTCLSCVAGYFLDPPICRRCSVNITNCNECLNQTHCVSCALGYFISSPSACTPCSSNCITCDINGCLSCELGFYFDISTPACVRCSQQCSECTDASTCSSCVPGYFFISSNSTCGQCLTGCDTCNTSTNCLSCVTGYALLANGSCAFCYDLIDNCVSCDSTTCFLCIYGFVPDSTNSNFSCKSCSSISGCQHCSTIAYCEVCSAGYYEDGSGGCLPCSQGCTNCASNVLCFACLPAYLLQTPVCTSCQTLVQGCQYCSGPTTCVNCLQGYYITTPSCTLCRNAIEGCASCNDSSICTNCHDGFYLQPSNNTCQLCLGGCQHCNSSSICTQCQSGFYLQTNACVGCGNISPGCATCVSASCLNCKARYYLSSGSCTLCSQAIPSCILCTSASICLQCEAGMFLNSTNKCQTCPLQGCEVCNDTAPLQCVSCNSHYFLNTNICQRCSISLPNCIECSSSALCAMCQSGYYILPDNTCGICSQAPTLQGCQMCSSSVSCNQCKSGYFLNSGNTCSKCINLIPGCGFCQSSTVCQSCLNGYFYDGAGGCNPCTDIDGCLICTNATACSFCKEEYYLDTSTQICQLCNATMTGCRSCMTSTECVLCTGKYQLSGFSCVQIKGKFAEDIPQLKLSSFLENAQQLIHFLDARNGQFVYSEQNWTTAVQLTLVDESDKQTVLTIKSGEWERQLTRIKFRTNNPLNSSDMKSMPFIKRLLLQGSLPSHFKVKMVMNEQTIRHILPKLAKNSDLVLDYSLDQPEFYASFISFSSNHLYYLIGTIITILLFLAYIIKAIATATESDDKGEIIPHIFAIKCAALTLYPTGGEFINFCYGFMMADLPWLNQIIGDSISEPSDFTYPPYRLYYVNMNFASTYLFAFTLYAFAWFISFLIGLGFKNLKKEVASFQSFLYLFCITGLIVAAIASVQGAFLNNIDSPTINSIFYILGICIYLGIFLEIIYSLYTCQKLIKFYKLRVFIKITILSLAHLAPIALSVVCVILDVIMAILQCFIMFEIKPHPKTWLCVQVILNLALVLVLYNPEMIITFIAVTLLILLGLTIDSYIHAKQFIEQHKIMKVKIDQKSNQSKVSDSNIDIEHFDQQPDMHKITHYDFRDKSDEQQNQITEKTVVTKERKKKPRRQSKDIESNETAQAPQAVHPYAMFLTKK